MATVTTPSASTPGASLPIQQAGVRLFTAADLAAMPDHLPSGDVWYELHNGRLIIMPPPGARHGNVQVLFGSALVTQGQLKGHGRAYTEVGILLWRNPDHVFGADAAFLTSHSLPERLSPEGYLEGVPELVVEVRSKNDTKTEVAAKVADYLKAGVKLVWTANPDARTMIEHRPGVAPKEYAATDTLECEDIIPGFRLALADLFRQ